MDFLCSGCSLPKPIQNKKHNLCTDCVFKKNHNGLTQAEVYSEREKSRASIKSINKIEVINSTNIVKKSKRKKKTKSSQQLRQEEIDIQIKLLKEQIRQEAINNDNYHCVGCMKTSYILDCSHIISVKQEKSLELVKENIQLLCRDCHIKWESWEFEKMSSLYCFKSNLEFIKDHSTKTYYRILSKEEEYNERRQGKEAI
jgi:5-methylcytosine-specific restriction endonuclease McrA